ncbi:DUF1810 domain-containing protein [Fluoribacter gormanii]|uniref:Uncharacterized conserved protein n=1 Tax=Fluoribacter gormanii TaxID=464 RepID=A0A377GLP0_9GAMM|nr:DUF1810 family protein [Fluoribacter gormanii]KTD01959.1 hypothetical protein Lgor_2072 [Fluoribacter gormanii]MCW8442863.1 DUF1810 domain-containing protein [Fluoribacter gormanii]MCW8471332.1 DUF1810 domain-containing protein [Fluoribacter gormanii]SIR78671.1 Uncharacterized protein, DUF1810 family [Fluoribacter gormanii]STO25534.1 Uncharacterized conserved protein [Fluoribacter gormanii]
MSNIQRFIKAQQSQDIYVSFQQAYTELESGSKQSHWIWYIFPQLKQLGFSSIAQHFGIVDFKEACAYLQDELLFRNYHAIAQLVKQQLKTISVLTLMHGEIDTKKLVSSLTLFREAASFLLHHGDTSQDFAALVSCCEQILKETTKQGYAPCELTLKLVRKQKNQAS